MNNGAVDTEESVLAQNSSDTQNLPEDKSDNRKEWQKPELVMQILGNLDGQVIADLGAGTGYFSFRLMRKAKHVIAIDIDPIMLKMIPTSNLMR